MSNTDALPTPPPAPARPPFVLIFGNGNRCSLNALNIRSAKIKAGEVAARVGRNREAFSVVRREDGVVVAKRSSAGVWSAAA